MCLSRIFSKGMARKVYEKHGYLFGVKSAGKPGGYIKGTRRPKHPDSFGRTRPARLHCEENIFFLQDISPTFGLFTAQPLMPRQKNEFEEVRIEETYAQRLSFAA